jgi:hypothetical protein
MRVAVPANIEVGQYINPLLTKPIKITNVTLHKDASTIFFFVLVFQLPVFKSTNMAVRTSEVGTRVPPFSAKTLNVIWWQTYSNTAPARNILL